MYLKSLEILGFKSFAKKANLSFTSPISAIVGPNGSGKSNVAEAFRFVLGEQSIKSLRGKRGEDLIFNGGGGISLGTDLPAGGFGTRGASPISRANFATVKVVFDNSKRMLNVDFDEVTIERTVHRDNTNEYAINGSPVRLKDIVELLAQAHIGSSGHHIISQGEADRILNANIRERREMVEDALGLKIYHYKKIDSKRKLEKTQENMASVESLRRELAPHLKFLKKQVEKIEKVQEMRISLSGLYKEYFKREEVYIQHEKARLEQAKQGPVAELKQLDADLAEARKILEESKNADATSSEVISLERQVADARVKKDQASRDLGKIEGEVHSVARALEREKEKQIRDESKTVYLRDVEAMVKEVEALEVSASIDNVPALFEAVKRLLFGFISKHKSTESTHTIVEFQNELESLSSKKAAYEQALREASSTETALQQEYTALRQRIEREKDTNREAEKNVFRIVARQNEVRSLLHQLKTEEDRIAVLDEAFKREIHEAFSLAGREATDFHSFVVTTEEVMTEQRRVQEERHHHIEKIKIRIEDSGVGSASEVLKEYKEAEERDAFLAKELVDLEAAKTSLTKLIDELDTRLAVEFREGVLKINAQFGQFFSLMFGGGAASLTVIREKKRKKRSDTDLSLDDSAYADGVAESGDREGKEDDTEEGEEGIDIQVSLPRKKIKGLMMLSGGERALTSIALLFAISQVNPPPFIILDETDAALDEANSKKYGDMISSLSQYSQLILITHNRETMSRAGILYGVTMGSEGASKLLSIQFDEAVRVAK